MASIICFHRQHASVSSFTTVAYLRFFLRTGIYTSALRMYVQDIYVLCAPTIRTYVRTRAGTVLVLRTRSRTAAQLADSWYRAIHTRTSAMNSPCMMDGKDEIKWNGSCIYLPQLRALIASSRQPAQLTFSPGWPVPLYVPVSTHLARPMLINHHQ